MYDEKEDSIGFNAIVQYMIHGPYSNANIRSLCMINGRCSKYFPKRFQTETTLIEDWFPIYKGKDDGKL